MEGADDDPVGGGPGNWFIISPPVVAYVPCGICAYCTFLSPSDFLNALAATGPGGGPAGDGEAKEGGGMGGATLVSILGCD